MKLRYLMLLLLLPVATASAQQASPLSADAVAAQVSAARAEYERATVIMETAREHLRLAEDAARAVLTSVQARAQPATVAIPLPSPQPVATSASQPALAAVPPPLPPAAPPVSIPSPASVVLQQVEIAALPVLGTLMVPLFGWGMAIFSKRTGIQLTEQQKAAVYQAAETGKGLFLAHLATGKAQVSDAHPSSSLIQALTSQAITAVPDSAAALGIDHDKMAQIITGAVGRAISTDPTIPTMPLAVIPPTTLVDAALKGLSPA